MDRAAAAVHAGSSIRSVAKDFNCDRMTLKRFIDHRAANAECIGYEAISQKHAVFSPQVEEDLASHVKSLANQLHGLSLEKCCQLTYEFASANDLTMPANWSRNGLVERI